MKRNMIALLVLCAALVLTGCGKEPTEPTEEVATEATVAATVPADGNPDDVTCQGTYTVTAQEAAAAAGTAVATVGDAKLTNGQLQAAYWLEVAAYRQSGQEPQPDYSQALDTQVCPIDDGVGSWQQYFLREALDSWAVRQALLNRASDEKMPTEEAYNPVVENHEKHLANIPATKYLYGYNNSWQPNEMHQAYLDSIPDLLETLAKELGYTDAEAMASAIAATGKEELAAFAVQYNTAYMYYTEWGYHFEPTQEEILLHYEANKDVLDTAGDSRTVDLRHILVIPEGAQVAGDGTVTATEEQWKGALETAKRLHSKWRHSNYHREAEFAVIANEESDDNGTKVNGGLYQQLQPGDLIAELDAWCFDPARETGDTEIIRTACGYHVVYLSDITEDRHAAARASLIALRYETLIRESSEKYPMKTNWNAICLAEADMDANAITAEKLLYPDVAHERYPTIPLFLQQDYPDTYYGAYKIRTHGCGITTLAMIASYFTDEEWTPPELCELYGRYCGEHGTNIKLFDDEPAALGFFLDRRSYNWTEILQAIRDGYVVVSLQYAGYWTRGGHFLAIQEITDDDQLVIRDSNIFNYGKLEGHYVDSFNPNLIPPAGMFHWIYQKKVTTIPACVRCGADSEDAPPEALLHTDYLCGKCRTATARRDSYLAGIAG